MSREDFEQLVRNALLDIPKRLRRLMDNVGIVIEDFPTKEQMSKGGTLRGDLLLGLYEGVPRTKRGPFYTMVLPDKITIFQKPVEMASGSDPERIKKLVKDTVWHEVAHHFGFDEPAVRQLARKRKK